MKVELLHHTPLWVCSKAIRKCWSSEDKSDTVLKGQLVGNEYKLPAQETVVGDNDKALIDRVGNKNKHSSTLEHLSYNFDIDGISRACLQELARHRHASLSVKSTRYTLKELKNEAPFTNTLESIDRASNYIYLTHSLYINENSIKSLEKLRLALQMNIPNDVAKYCLPEAYKTSLAWTINARSLQNFLTLRTNKAALWEIRELANAIFEALPEDHKYLFRDCLYKEEKSVTDAVEKALGI